MTAKGKINAANVQINDRIIVKVYRREVEADRDVLDFLELDHGVGPSDTKTGEGVQVARVINKSYTIVSGGRRRDRRVYVIETSVGTFECAPIQTMWLAPEDAAGVKRAHVEALAEDRERDLAAHEEPAQAAHTEALTLHSQDGKVDNMSSESTPAEPTATPAAEEMDEPSSTAQMAAEDHTGSTVVRLLEKVWARIRADHPELPEVVIITGSGLVGASKWGHFRAEGWKLREEGAAVRKHELFLAGEALAKGARQVLQTMLHEAAHTLARVRGQQDTSRQGRWHNATFRKTAEELGLEHKGSQAHKTHGFSFVTLTADTAEKYADLLTELDAEIRLVCHLPLWMGGEADQDEGGEKIAGKPTQVGEGGPRSGPMKATCLCEEPVIVRISQKVMDMAVVRCDDCKALFLDRS